MGQTLPFQRQIKSIERRINLKALIRWEQKNIRELRGLHRQVKAEGMTPEERKTFKEIANRLNLVGISTMRGKSFAAGQVQRYATKYFEE